MIYVEISKCDSLIAKRLYGFAFFGNMVHYFRPEWKRNGARRADSTHSDEMTIFDSNIVHVTD